MKRILTALILIPLVLLLVFLGPRWLITLAVAGLAAIAAWEYMGMAERGGPPPPRVAVLVAIVALFLGNFYYFEQTAAIFGCLSLGLLVYCTFRSKSETMIADAALSVFCFFYTGLSLLSLPALREEANGPSLVTFLLFVVWAGDIAAYYIGRTFGKHKLAPRLSPNKTWEGAIGSTRS